MCNLKLCSDSFGVLTGPIRILANVPQIPGFLSVIIMRLTDASRQSFRLQPTPWGARNAARPVGNPCCTISTPGPSRIIVISSNNIQPEVAPSPIYA
jgi:hypothetical protein